MPKHNQKTYRDQTVVLDGNEFDQCVFENCTLEYQGVKVVNLSGSTLNNCQWSFKGPAANAVQFMSAMYQSSPQGALLIESTFNTIRGIVPAIVPRASNSIN